MKKVYPVIIGIALIVVIMAAAYVSMAGQLYAR